MAVSLKKTHWSEIHPRDALELDLRRDTHIIAPINELGEKCPWPWEPQQLVGAPLGQYHCGFCGGMVIAGMPHFDLRDLPLEDQQMFLGVGS